jgi:polar amino acid transport system substrate-binding protein
MNMLVACGLPFLVGAIGVAAQTAPVQELAPTGKVRVAVGVGAAPSAFWTTREASSGEPRGVTVDLAQALSRKLGVPLELVRYASSGEITDAGPKGEWDVTFMPKDDARARVVDFGPDYSLQESTYLVASTSSIRTLADIDRPGVKVAGVANTATGRSAERTLKHARIVSVKGQDDLLPLLTSGGADAIALSREALTGLRAQLPGARILDGAFHQAGIAVAVPKGRSAALAYVTRFVEEVKAAGDIRRALDRAGLPEAVVAPPAR